MGNSSNGAIEFHWGSACNQCKTSPIQGVRYKCCICSNYDLCPNCQSLQNIHDKSHPFIQLKVYKNKFSRFGVSANNTMFVGLNELCNNLGLVLGVNNNGNPQKKPIKAVNRRFDRKNVTRKWTT